MSEIQKQAGPKHQETRTNLLHTLLRAAKAEHAVDVQWGWDPGNKTEPRILVDGVPVQVDDGDVKHPVYVVGRPPYTYAADVPEALLAIKSVLG